MRLSQSVVLFILALFPCAAHATITVDTVQIGNPGNPPDTRYIDTYHPSGVGAVAKPFRMGTTEVTNAQYVAFLQAVAAADPYGLYSTQMAFCCHGGIVRSGVSGSFTYSIKAPALSGAYTYGNKPVVWVSSGDAMRFANWLHNGQPSGAEDATTTENGAYTLNGATSDAALAAVTRNSGARWWLPSENEWYKAAYHKNDGATGNYWDYPTGTNSVPNNNQPAFDTGNSANFYNNGYTTGNSSVSMTDAGAYALSRSPYGTLDQGGNVWDWDEALFNGASRGIRGGSCHADSGYLRASGWYDWAPSFQDSVVGFRVASADVPEPSTMLLVGFAALAGFGFLRGRR